MFFKIIDDLGLGVIKNTSKVIWGAGETVIGFVTEDSELLEKGTKKVVGGGIGIGSSLLMKNVINSDESENIDFDA